MPDLRVLLSPDGDRIAQSIPDDAYPRPPDPAHNWLCMTFPNGALTANLLTDEDVAGWREVSLDPPAGGG